MREIAPLSFGMSIGETVSSAREAEKLGFGSFTIGELFHMFRSGGYEARSSTTLAAAVALNTKSIKIGLTLVNPYLRHPAQLAMEASTLDELSNGRLFVTLGAAKSGIVHYGFDSQDKIRPLQTIGEAVAIIRQLLSGNGVKFDGKIFTVHAPPLISARRYRTNIPIYIGATGPMMMQLAGEMADGIITASISSPDWIRYTLGQAQEGAERSGKNLKNWRRRFDVGATLVCSVDEDGDRARRQARRLTASYLAGKVINIGKTAEKLLQVARIKDDEVKPIVDAIRMNDPVKASQLVSDDLMRRAVPAVGSPEEVVRALKEFDKAGVKMACLEITGDYSKTIRLIAKKVMPEVLSTERA